MDTSKQINELAADIFEHIKSYALSRALASLLYAKGYRKTPVTRAELDALNEYQKNGTGGEFNGGES